MAVPVVVAVTGRRTKRAVMDFLRPASWEEALAAKAEHPTAVPIAGGTDVMVEINFDHRRPEYLLDLNRIGRAARVGGRRGGACGSAPPSRTRGSWRTCAPSCPVWRWPRTRSPPRRSATAAASAATSAPPPRPATPTRRCSRRAPRSRRSRCAARGRIPIDEFFTGVKRNALAADELIKRRPHQEGERTAAVLEGRHPQRDGHRGLRLRPSRCTPRPARCSTGIGSAAPTPVRAMAAEEFLNAALEEGGFWDSGAGHHRRRSPGSSPSCAPARATRSTTYAAPPTYRRHAVGVMARRTLSWTWESYRGSGGSHEGGCPMRVTLHRQRTSAGGRRRVGGRVPAVRPA